MKETAESRLARIPRIIKNRIMKKRIKLTSTTATRGEADTDEQVRWCDLHCWPQG